MGRKKTGKRRSLRIPRLLGLPVYYYEHLHWLTLVIGSAIGYFVSIAIDPHNGLPFMETPQRYIPILLGTGLGFMVGEMVRRMIYHSYYDENNHFRQREYDDEE